MIYQEFYAELGKLLYAVSHIDSVISHQEKKALQELVRQELAAHEKTTDAHGTNSAFMTETAFDFEEENDTDSETAFLSFVDFVKDHYSAFDSKLSLICQKVAEKLAAAYYKTNSKEEKLINELREFLQSMG